MTDLRWRASFFVVVAGLATLVSAGVLQVMGGDKPAKMPNDPGFKSAMMWFELANSREEVYDALGPADTAPGQLLRRRLDAQNKYDYMFMVCYSLFNAALIYFVTHLNTYRFDKLLKLRVFLILGLLVAVTMFVGDVIENVQLLALTKANSLSEIDDRTIQHLFYWTRVKWGAIFLACLMLSAGYTAYFRRIQTFLLPTAFAVAGVSGFVALSVLNLRYVMEVVTVPCIVIAWFASLVHAGVYAYRSMPAATDEAAPQTGAQPKV